MMRSVKIAKNSLPASVLRRVRAWFAGRFAENLNAKHKRKIEELKERHKQTLAHERTRAALLTKELAKAQRYEFGSFTPGVDAWKEKWASAKGRRVLFLTPLDYAGSFMRWAEAIHAHTDYAVRMISYRRHARGYDLDLLLPDPQLVDHDIDALLDQADVLHIKDEKTIFEGENDRFAEALASAKKPVVFTHFGSWARKYENHEDYRAFVGSFAARVAMTPDVCYKWFNGLYIPQAIDAERFKYCWSDGRKLGHSPSQPLRKSTPHLVEAVEGLDITLDVITDVPYAECLARKRTCSLFFDQAGQQGSPLPWTNLGWYGNSALEAAVHGIPTIAHLSDYALDLAEASGVHMRESCAILNTQPGVEGIRETIQRYFDLTHEERVALSRRTRQWVEEFHSYSAVGRMLAEVYRGLH